MTDTATAAYSDSATPRRSWRRTLILLTLAFVAGIAAMGWGLSRWDAARNWLLGTTTSAQLPPIAYDPRPAPQPAPLIGQAPVPDMAARLAAIEARTARLESAGGSASSAVRAEGLLVTFAARRAIDRGIGLGYVEGLLNQSFAASQPRAVATVIAAARQPVTIDQLQTELEALTPALTGGDPNEGWWQSFRRGLSGLIIVRDAETPSPDPAARVARAAQMLRAGRVDVALAEIARLPARDAAAGWMEKARRHIEAHRALDLLEAAAITARDASAAQVRVPL